jgi:hypothetical protein
VIYTLIPNVSLVFIFFVFVRSPLRIPEVRVRKSLSAGDKNRSLSRQLPLTTLPSNRPYIFDSYVCSGYSTEPNRNTFTYWSEHSRVPRVFALYYFTQLRHLAAEWVWYFMWYSYTGVSCLKPISRSGSKICLTNVLLFLPMGACLQVFLLCN